MILLVLLESYHLDSCLFCIYSEPVLMRTKMTYTDSRGQYKPYCFFSFTFSFRKPTLYIQQYHRFGEQCSQLFSIVSIRHSGGHTFPVNSWPHLQIYREFIANNFHKEIQVLLSTADKSMCPLTSPAISHRMASSKNRKSDFDHHQESHKTRFSRAWVQSQADSKVIQYKSQHLNNSKTWLYQSL